MNCSKSLNITGPRVKIRKKERNIATVEGKKENNVTPLCRKKQTNKQTKLTEKNPKIDETAFNFGLMPLRIA